MLQRLNNLHISFYKFVVSLDPQWPGSARDTGTNFEGKHAGYPLGPPTIGYPGGSLWGMSACRGPGLGLAGALTMPKRVPVGTLDQSPGGS